MKNKTYHVTPREDGSWQVKAMGGVRASSTHATKKEAVEAARKFAARTGAELSIEGASGRLREEAAVYHAPKVKAPEPQSGGSEPLAKRVGSRIRRARTMAGHSLRSLEEAIGGEVSHTMLGKFESGEAMPGTKVLARIGQALKVRPDYFYKRDSLKLTTAEYRGTLKLGKKPRQRLEEKAYEFFERYLEIENILGMEAEDFPTADVSGLDAGSLPAAIEQAAVKLRKIWDLGMNPIPNVHAMLENHGVKVKILDHEEGFDGFSAFAENNDGLRVPVIALSSRCLKEEKDLPRFRFTAIHELAHLYLNLPEELTHKQKENYCHWFAGAFLVPSKPFEERFGVNRVKIALKELIAIKAEWGISLGAMMKRACNLGLVTAGRYKTYCIVSARNKWTKNEPGRWVGEEKSKRFEPLVLRALAQELISTSKAAGLLGVSLPELAEKFETID